jgi:hypothetical protein
MAKASKVERKISFAALKKSALAGELSKKDLALYFLPEESASEPTAPAAKLNPETVTTTGRPPTTAQVTDVLLQAQAKLAEQEAEAGRSAKPKLEASKPESKVIAKARAKAAKAKLKVLSEGDSWFNLPFWYPPTAIDVLDETYDMGRVAKWGDEISDMVREKQYLQPLKAGLYRHFLFSGGGNDVLGGISLYVKKRTAAGTDPNIPASFVKSAFASKVKEIIGHYRTLAADVRAHTEPDAVLYVHGYGHAIPKAGGKYIGKPLAQLGFDPASALAKGIVVEMVRAFNAALMAFAASQARVVYVDMRAAMGANDWHSDEIHPAKSGARKVASRFSEAIMTNVPVA